MMHKWVSLHAVSEACLAGSNVCRGRGTGTNGPDGGKLTGARRLRAAAEWLDLSIAWRDILARVASFFWVGFTVCTRDGWLMLLCFLSKRDADSPLCTCMEACKSGDKVNKHSPAQHECT